MPVTGHADSLAVRSLLRRPNLTAEHERQLLRARHASGDEAARQQALQELWESHAKLVLAVARQYHRPDLSMSELVGAGHLGMRAAIDGFDPDQGDIRLSTYAVGWIRHYITGLHPASCLADEALGIAWRSDNCSARLVGCSRMHVVPANAKASSHRG